MALVIRVFCEKRAVNLDDITMLVHGRQSPSDTAMNNS